MNSIEFQKLRFAAEQLAIKQAEKDILFSAGSNPFMKKLSEDEKQTVCTALKCFAGAGAARAVDMLKSEGYLAGTREYSRSVNGAWLPEDVL